MCWAYTTVPHRAIPSAIGIWWSHISVSVSHYLPYDNTHTTHLSTAQGRSLATPYGFVGRTSGRLRVVPLYGRLRLLDLLTPAYSGAAPPAATTHLPCWVSAFSVSLGAGVGGASRRALRCDACYGVARQLD